MIDGADELRRLAEGTILAGREVIELDVPAPMNLERSVGGDRAPKVVAVRIEPDEVLAAWQVGRDLLQVTGRWPVVTCAWGGYPRSTGTLDTVAEALLRFEFDQEDVGPADPASIIERSRTVDVDSELASIAQLATWLEDPDPAAVAAPVPGHLDWFEPRGQVVALLLLPVESPEDVLAYLHWFAAGPELPSHVLIALLRAWRAEFGAELVAHWGTMLQLVVRDPPRSMARALGLARHQELVAPCTTLLAGVTTEQHAAALLGADRWFLHERP